jgi:iron-sulfur cluster repair protein YtfE (RIC family)
MMMQRLTEPLRDEHAALLPRVDALAELADGVEGRTLAELMADLEAASSFLHRQLLVHAHLEEAVLYPAVERAMGSVGATATMARDHAAIGRLAQDLDEARAPLSSGVLPAETLRRLRRILYGLQAVAALHFAKEEEVYLPLLDERLSTAEATRLFESMEGAAARMRAA